MLGKCSGGVTGDIGLGIPDEGGTLRGIGAGYLNSVFGAGECACDTNDVNLQIKLSQAYPVGTVVRPEVWIGPSCDQLASRIGTSATCQKIDVTTITPQTFVIGGTTGTDFINIPIPATRTFAPLTRTCDENQHNNGVWVLLFTTDDSTPNGTCTLTPTASGVLPQKPTNVTAGGGEKAVTLNWDTPSSTLNKASFFQILCADDQGQVVPGLRNDNQEQAYTTCVDGNIRRRQFPATTGGGGTDGGVVTTTDAGARPLPPIPLGPQAIGDDLAGADLTGVDMAVPSGPTAFATTINPDYICSNKIQSNQTSARIEGLINGKQYQFAVIAINDYSNASASDVLTASPQPTEDLWERINNSGAHPNGFCEVGPRGRPLWLIEALGALLVAAWIVLRWARRA
jgi:hypothetical protein